ncbi:MAG: ribonuclease R [Firmicutes bacterium]|nr:ribonuclease R [Bacillota bacterium]
MLTGRGQARFKERILFALRENKRPMTFEQLRRKLAVKKGRGIKKLYQLLDSLERNGQVVKNFQGRYGLPESQGCLTGRIQGHARGFAFLLPDKPGESDVFLPPDSLGGALHGDRVLVRLKAQEGSKSREGEVLRILEKRNPRFTGTYERSRKGGFVVPDDRRLQYDFFIPLGAGATAHDGDKVVAEITRRKSGQGFPEGKIVEVLGVTGAPGVDITVLQKEYGLPDKFPKAVEKELDKLPLQVDVEAALAEGRLDLRELPIVTIDGADAKDLDDAVSLEKTAVGYRLGVHIADVSHYVQEGSALDKEALKRGNSVYLVDRVIPMLPPRLSNDLCSLNPQAERLAVSTFIDFDQQGNRLAYHFAPSIICSRERMTYETVQKILDGDPAFRSSRYEPLVGMFEDMKTLALQLKEKRRQRGAIDFDLPETKVFLDEDGHPLAVEKRALGIAENIIEEFMLACNEVVASHFYQEGVPFIYRVHGKPEVEKLAALRDLLTLFGLSLPGDLYRAKPADLQRLLERAKGTRGEKLVGYLLLRSMQQARYSAEWQEHFGLAAQYYTHFTSPIRRYGDLCVHRILRHCLQKDLTLKRRRKLALELPKVAEHISHTERVAADAERESVELKKIEYMQGKEGEVFEGIVSGVTSFGLFVELENTVEGMLHVSALEDDYYRFHEKQYALVGENTGKTFRLGEPLRVKLIKVNLSDRMIDFALA